MTDQKFKLKSNYAPSGDQPQAIEVLVTGIKEGKDFNRSSELQVPEKTLRWQTSLLK